MTNIEAMKLALNDLEMASQKYDCDESIAALRQQISEAECAVLAEREACAKVCDAMSKTMPDRDGEITEWCAAAIRARGKK